MNAACEYLVGYGQAGEFARFRGGLACARGDRVVVRTVRGLEVGRVLCPVVEGHAPFLSRTALGELLRAVSSDDERTLEALHARGRRIFRDACDLSAGLPVVMVDAEVLLDERQAIIYHLRQQALDFTALIDELGQRHGLAIVMENLALPAEEHEHPAGGGCGKPDCGQAEGGGGCSSCGSGGGCSTCGKGIKAEDLASLLAGMEQPATRTPLL